MDNAARTRQRVLALFLPIAAVLYISAEALSPKGTDQVVTDTATALKLLVIAAKHPTQVYIAGTCAVLGLGALAVSYAAIAALARNRGAALATVAALIGGIGAFCGAITNVLVYPNLAAATAHLTPAAAARFLVATFNSGFGQMFLTVATIVNSALPFVSAACRAMLLCLAKGILLTFLAPHFGSWTGMVMGPRWARQVEPRGPRINAGEQHRVRAA